MQRSIYDALHQEEYEHCRQVDRRALYWIGKTVKVSDTVWSTKLGVITKTKMKKREKRHACSNRPKLCNGNAFWFARQR